MNKKIRLVHYLNQFFGGLGGEDKANLPLQVVEGQIGPGRPLQQSLGDKGEIVATLVCGDNYINEEKEQARAAVLAALERLNPDVVVAGPAFDSGRYGLACGEVCAAARIKGIPAVTAMHPDNPGVTQYRREVYILPTGDNPGEMVKILSRMAQFALKLGQGTLIGQASEEGYLPRGIRKTTTVAEPGWKRAVDMLAAKVNGRPFHTEIPVLLPERVRPAMPIADPSKAVIGLVTTGGLIPKGNPDRQVSSRPDKYLCYSVGGQTTLDPHDWEAFHGGYFNGTARENPNYILPLKPMRILESQGVVGKVHPVIFTMPGVGTPVLKAKGLGSEIAQELVEGGVDGVLLVST